MRSTDPAGLDHRRPGPQRAPYAEPVAPPRQETCLQTQEGGSSVIRDDSLTSLERGVLAVGTIHTRGIGDPELLWFAVESESRTIRDKP